MKFFHELGISSLSYDARAHGESEGKTSTIGLQKEPADLANVHRWAMEKELHPEILYGRSMGAATALVQAKSLNARLAILDCPYAGLDMVLDQDLQNFTYLPLAPLFAYEMLAQVRLRGLDLTQNRPVDAARQLDNPRLLLFHSKQDPKLPISHSYVIYNAAKRMGNSARLLVTHSQGHSTNFTGYSFNKPPKSEERQSYNQYPLRYLETIGQELMLKYGYSNEQIQEALAITLEQAYHLEQVGSLPPSIDSIKPLTEKNRDGIYRF